MKDNIVLIGMPGVGKSTIGVILAKMLGMEFVDSDLVIQKEEGRLLKDIIATQGVDGFVEVENRINASLNVTNSVIATGGSVVYGLDAMKHLSHTGTVVYIRQSLTELKKRLSNIKNRGVVLRDGQTLEDLYTERCRLYERYADITVDEEGLDIEQTLNSLIDKLNNYNN
ncbi:MAG: shikimate kinase [Lachnospiraceae bacterium]|nr:shikimate kinase [Lachnospiraceae bacterium]